MAIESSEPVEYLGAYIATCKSSIIFFLLPEIAEEFKKIMVNFTACA